MVRKKLANGNDRWFVYAYRGGPRIHAQDGRKPAITPDLLDAAYAARRVRGDPDGFDRIINLYRDSPDFAKLKPGTQRDYRIWLDRISQKWGMAPARLFNAPDARATLVAWRDSMAGTPRAADRAIGTLAIVLGWAYDRGLVSQNAAKGIKHLHKTNRADLIWEPRHWEAVAEVPTHIRRVLVLASLTGLRQGDLLNLRWEQVKPNYIAMTTAKTGGEAVIPMHDELAQALMGPGKGHVLRNSRAEPWTSSGFQSSWRKAMPEGFDRKFHDLRGTFVTRLAIAGFADNEIADVIGWTAERVASIRARYVDRARVAKARADRLVTGHTVNRSE
jgi:integrase